MPIVKEWRCAAHGEFENSTGKCPSGCPRSMVVQEIRTPPAYRRPGKMAWIDRQMQGIAADAGLTDMKSDGKAGVSVLANEMRRKELAGQAQQKKTGGKPLFPTWLDVPHAAPGFSRQKDAKVPTINAGQFGTNTGKDILGDIPNLSAPQLPPLRPNIVKRDPGGY